MKPLGEIEEETPLLQAGRQQQEDTSQTRFATERNQGCGPETVEDEDLDTENEFQDIEAATRLKRPSPFLICIFLFMIVFSMSVGDPTRIVMYNKLACNKVLVRDGGEVCDKVRSQVEFSNFMMAQETLTIILGLLIAPYLGKFSDIHGRKVVLLIANGGGLLGCGAIYYLIHHFQVLSNLLLLATVVQGVFFSVSILVMTGRAYVIDLAPQATRTYYFGFLNAFIYLGTLLGPVTNKAINSWGKKTRDAGHGLIQIPEVEFATLKMELICLAITLVGISMFLPESRPKHLLNKSRAESISSQRTNTTWINKLIELTKPLALLTYPPTMASNDKVYKIDKFVVISSVALLSIYSGLMSGFSNSTVQYGFYQFKWDSDQITLLSMSISISRIAVLVLIAPFLQKKLLTAKFKLRVIQNKMDTVDFTTAMLGLVLESGGIIFLALAPTSSLAITAAAFTCFGSLCTPTFTNMAVKYFPESTAGTVVGGLSFVENIANLVVVFVMNRLFNFSISVLNFPSLSFYFVIAVIYILALFLTVMRFVTSLE